MNEKGLQSYCQECGACGLSVEESAPEKKNKIVDLIVDEVLKILDKKGDEKGIKKGFPAIPLGVSNRHVHLKQETLAKLFGTGAFLESYRELYQPGEFASKQVVTIVGPKMKSIQNVRILGPLRHYDQVEISLTDAIYLGIKPPVGDLKNAAPLTLVGPAASIYLEHCAIIANRHLHTNSREAKIFGISDGDYCRVRIQGVKSTIFENVLVRVNDSWKLQIHLDTDDANAAYAVCADEVEFIEKMEPNNSPQRT
jgi:putative phosphotransacetylase